MAQTYWTRLASLQRGGYGSPPVNLNGHILICQGYANDTYDDDNRTIMKYNAIEDRWDRWWSETKASSKWRYLGIDQLNKKIFIHSGNVLTSYSYDDSLFLSEPIKEKVCCSGPGAYPIMINDRYTIVGGVKCNGHRLWFPKEKKLKKMRIDDELSHCIFPKVVRIKNKLLLMHGKTIYGCNLRRNLPRRYTKFEDVLPDDLGQFTCVVTRCNNYVIIFSGFKTLNHSSVTKRSDTEILYQNNIYILNSDIEKRKVTKSKIKCPCPRGIVRAINMGDYGSKDTLLVHGYLRTFWKTSELLPKCLEMLIMEFHSIEIVHVMDKKGNHWKINMGDILQ